MAIDQNNLEHIKNLRKAYLEQVEQYRRELEKGSLNEAKRAVGPAHMQEAALQADKAITNERNERKVGHYSAMLAQRMFIDQGGSLDAVDKLLEQDKTSQEFNKQSHFKEERLKQVQHDLRHQWQKSQQKEEHDQAQKLARKERLLKLKGEIQNLQTKGQHLQKEAIATKESNRNIQKGGPEMENKATEVATKVEQIEKGATGYAKEVLDAGSTLKDEFQRNHNNETDRDR